MHLISPRMLSMEMSAISSFNFRYYIFRHAVAGGEGSGANLMDGWMIMEIRSVLWFSDSMAPKPLFHRVVKR